MPNRPQRNCRTACPRGAAPRRPTRAEAFTLLEIQVALVLLAVGLLGIAGLMVRQSMQIVRVESWCVPDRTHYLLSQDDPWMMALHAPATLEPASGGTPWRPPVSSSQENEVVLLSYTSSLGTNQMRANVRLEP